MSAPFSIVFLGTPEFAVPSLRALACDPRFRVEVVVTQPDKPVGRKQILTAPPIKRETLALGIPVYQPERLNTAIKSGELILPPHDFLVTVAYGQLLSQEVLDLARIMPINVHASILPRWRGASPIQHSILAGDMESGVTIQRMVRALDAGPILGLKKVAIAERETSETLHDKLSDMGARLLRETLAAPLSPVEQDESGVTVCHKLSRESGRVDPSVMDAVTIDRYVRALVPWPGVECIAHGHTIKLLETSLTPSAESAELSCANGSTLHIETLVIPGKKPMSGNALHHGLRHVDSDA